MRLLPGAGRGHHVHVRPAAILGSLALALALGVVILAAPLWLPLVGTLLAVEDGLQQADAALVLQGTGTRAADRRAVLDTWLQVLVPFLREYQPDAGS